MLHSRGHMRACLTTVLLLALGTLPGQAAPRLDTVLLLHTNDVHDNLRPLSGPYGGLVYVSGYVHQARQQRPDVLAVDAGDISEKGDMLGILTEGRATYRAAAAVGYDAGAPGNHENAYGLERWAANVKASRFPLVACNVIYEDDKAQVFPAFREVSVDGVRVGIIGLGNAMRGTVAGRKVITLTPTAVATRLAELARDLKTRNELVVVVGHYGSRDCQKLAEAAPDVDVFVSGHTHEVLAEPLQASPGRALIVQTGDYARRVGELELTVDLDARKIASYRGRLVRLDHKTTPQDSALAEQLVRWNQELCPEALEVVARAPLSLPMSRATGDPSPLTRWMAEALRADRKADLAGFNNSMLRHELRSGPVSGDDLFKAVLNRDRRIVCEAECSGEQLLAAVEKLLAGSGARGMCFAGRRIVTDRSRPPGHRVVSSDIDAGQRYRLVMPSLLCRDTKGNSTLGVEMCELPYTVYEAAVNHARAARVIRVSRP